MIEKNLQDILNAGIGLFKAGEGNFKTAFANLEKTFEDLKQKGAADQSQSAVKLREALENSIRGVKDVQSKAETNFTAIMGEAQKSYAQVLEQVKNVVGEERIKDLNSRIDELAGYLKNKAGQGPSKKV